MTLFRQLDLERLFLASMVGAKGLSVRLRPELCPTESIQPLDDVSRAIENGALDGDPEARLELLMMTAQPPQSLLRAIYATLTDNYYGLAALGLASLRERSALRDKLLNKLPGIDGIAITDEARRALVRLWLAQWSTSVRGIWFHSMTDGDWWNTKGEVKPHTGKFQPIERWLGSAAEEVQPGLAANAEAEMCELVGGKYRLRAARAALETGGVWGYCERGRFTQRPFPDTAKCVSCGADRVRYHQDRLPDIEVSFASRSQEGGEGGCEVGGPGGVHEVPGGDRDQFAVRNERGHAGELVLVDVAGRAARDDQCRGLDQR